MAEFSIIFSLSAAIFSLKAKALKAQIGYTMKSLHWISKRTSSSCSCHDNFIYMIKNKTWLSQLTASWRSIAPGMTDIWGRGMSWRSITSGMTDIWGRGMSWRSIASGEWQIFGDIWDFLETNNHFHTYSYCTATSLCFFRYEMKPLYCNISAVGFELVFILGYESFLRMSTSMFPEISLFA